ncbi:MAG: hypothetical protein V2B18_22605 [Pseudomonadota bacterium]
MWVDLTKGEIEYRGQVIDLETDQGISLHSKGMYVEFMARVQVSRFSFRTHYYADVRRTPAAGRAGGTSNPTGSGHGYVNWLNWRVGADVDVFERYGAKLGLNIDQDLDRPRMSYNNLAGITANDGEIIGYPPLTIGCHASYYVLAWPTVSATLEFRYRFPYPYRKELSLRANPAEVTEWEYAVGLKLPNVVWGSAGLRVGHRNTKMEFAGSDILASSLPVSLSTVGYFGEFVWIY